MRNRHRVSEEQYHQGRGRDENQFPSQNQRLTGTREREAEFRDYGERGTFGDRNYGPQSHYERTGHGGDGRFWQSSGGDYRTGEFGGRGTYGERNWDARHEHGGAPRNYGGQRSYPGDQSGQFYGDRNYSGAQRAYDEGQRFSPGGDDEYYGSRAWNDPGRRFGEEQRGWSGQSDYDWRSRDRDHAGQDPRFQGQRFQSLASWGGYGNAGGPSTSRGRPPKGYKRSDERIREDVCDRLAEHPELDASDVEVKVQNGEVILTGTVPERRFKHVIEWIAESAAGVLDVRNEIRMQRSETRSESKSSSSSSERSSYAEPKSNETRRTAS